MCLTITWLCDWRCNSWRGLLGKVIVWHERYLTHLVVMLCQWTYIVSSMSRDSQSALPDGHGISMEICVLYAWCLVEFVVHPWIRMCCRNLVEKWRRTLWWICGWFVGVLLVGDHPWCLYPTYWSIRLMEWRTVYATASLRSQLKWCAHSSTRCINREDVHVIRVKLMKNYPSEDSMSFPEKSLRAECRVGDKWIVNRMKTWFKDQEAGQSWIVHLFLMGWHSHAPYTWFRLRVTLT